MHWDLLVRVVGLLLGSGVLMFLWKANRALNLWLDIMREFPPHRHVGQEISYPKGMRPDDTERLSDEAVTAKGRA